MTEDNPLGRSIEKLPPSPELAAALLANECQRDPQFSRQLQEDPRKLLESFVDGGDLGPIQIKLHDNTDHTWHLPLPAYNAEVVSLSEEQLLKVQAGEAVALSTLWLTSSVLAGLGATIAVAGLAASIGLLVRNTTS